MTEKAEGESAIQSQVSPQAPEGQQVASTPAAMTSHELLLRGVEELRRREAATTLSAEGKATAEVKQEESAAAPEGDEQAPEEKEQAQKPEPTVAQLQEEIAALTKRISGFQTAINEKHAEVQRQQELNARLQAEIQAMIELVEEGLDEEERRAFRQSLNQKAQSYQAREIARAHLGAMESRVAGLLERLEKAGMKLEGQTIAERVLSAAKQGIDIGQDARSIQEGYERFLAATIRYEAEASAQATQQRVEELEKQIAELQKKLQSKKVEIEMARGLGATNLGSAGGPGVDLTKASPRQLIELGIEAKRAAGQW